MDNRLRKKLKATPFPMSDSAIDALDNLIVNRLNRWPDGEEGLLVKKLRNIVLSLTNNQIFLILEAVITTCPHCWNTDISGDRQCTCERDE